MSFFEGCTALITGATAGIGREFVRQLAPIAGHLVLVARRRNTLEEIRQMLQASYPDLQVSIYAVDLADAAAVDNFAEELDRSGVRINFLINNAGLGDHGPFESSDWEKVRRMLQVNIVALTRLTHRLLPHLQSFEESAILNVASIAGLLPIPDMAVYAATKAYVCSFSEALRVELRGSGVSVTQLCPGPVDTEFGRVANRPGSEDSMPAPEIFKVPVQKVVGDALRAVENDRARVIPGFLVAAVITVAAAVPIFLLREFLSAKSSKN